MVTFDNQFVRIKKLNGKGIIRSAARHNLREIQAELGAGGHINAQLTPLNQVIEGALTADAVSAYADALMLDAGVGKLRKDAVFGLEFVISLPPTSKVDQSAYFADALAWVQKYYSAPVLSAVVHSDEAAPHCHILLLPLTEGRMKGSDMMGNSKRLQAMHMSFHETVGKLYGLVRPKPAQRISAATRNKSSSLVVTTLQSDPTLMDQPEIEAALLKAIGRDPEPFLTALNLSIPHPPKSNKSFVEIMTKPCSLESPSNPIGFAGQPKSIGFGKGHTEDQQTLSSVGFGFPLREIPDRNAGIAAEFSRDRDDAPSENWNSILGEFVAPSVQTEVSVRDIAANEIKRGLAQLQRRSSM